jgi:hypothetical protein
MLSHAEKSWLLYKSVDGLRFVLQLIRKVVRDRWFHRREQFMVALRFASMLSDPRLSLIRSVVLSIFSRS